MKGRLACGTLVFALLMLVGLRGYAAESMFTSSEIVTYSLEKVMRDPGEFVGKEVFFLCRFADSGDLYKPQQTRYNAADHVNFAVWPEHAELWSDEGRMNALPTLYAAKRNKPIVQAVAALESYRLVAVTGRVTSDYANTPWILVSKIEAVDRAGAKLDPNAVHALHVGLECLYQDDADSADRHFEKALSLPMPEAYLAAASEFSAHAKIAAGDMRGARYRLREAIQLGRNDPVLHLAMAEVCLALNENQAAMEHARAAMARPAFAVSALGVQAEAKAAEGDLAAAFDLINRAARTPSISARDTALTDVRRARIYKRTGRIEDAGNLYAALVKPDYPLADEPWLNNEVGAFHETLYFTHGAPGSLDIAYDCYERAAAPGRSGMPALQKMAEIEFRRQKASARPDFAKVKALVERMRGMLPEYVPAQVLEARILAAGGKEEEASELYAALAVERVADDSACLTILAEAYADIGKYEQANMLAMRAVNLRPWDERPAAIGRYIAALPLKPSRALPQQPETVESVEPAPTQRQPETGGRLAIVPVQPKERPQVFQAAAPVVVTQPDATAPTAEIANPAGQMDAAAMETSWRDFAPQAPAVVEYQNIVGYAPGVAATYNDFDHTREVTWFDLGSNASGVVVARAAPMPQPVVHEIPVANVPSVWGEVDHTREVTWFDLGPQAHHASLPAYLPATQPVQMVQPVQPAYSQTHVAAVPSIHGEIDHTREVTWFDLGPNASGVMYASTETYMTSAAPAYVPVDNRLPVSRVVLAPDRQSGRAGHEALSMTAVLDSQWGAAQPGEIVELQPVVLPEPLISSPETVSETSSALATPQADIFRFDDREPLASVNGARAPAAEEEDAPLLIAGYVAENRSRVELPVRNANLYRKEREGGKRPAEIIEGEPAKPEPRISAMSPSDDGKTHVTQVLLPGSPRGIGGGTDLEPLSY